MKLERRGVPTLPVSLLRDAIARETARLSLRRATQRRVARPPNVGQLVRLVAELSGDLSPRQTVQLGRDIATLLAEAYEARRLSPPAWVRSLLRQYRTGRRKAAGQVA